ncbi:hypothetical protein [Paenibacillus sp. GYB003]|uniref:hypothetical protein n=1 Tax=Paenibacillus sp. GYB003 TaxID=2994392 RepID=UPI002F9692D8
MSVIERELRLQTDGFPGQTALSIRRHEHVRLMRSVRLLLFVMGGCRCGFFDTQLLDSQSRFLV